jgi:branched-subunit amino acid ABC-type transport system permease component
MFSFELLYEAVIFGLLLGCFYAAVSLGLSVAFGLLDVPHVAHPALLVVGSYGAYLLGGWGIDPLLSGLLLMPVFFVVGMLLFEFVLQGISYFFAVDIFLYFVVLDYCRLPIYLPRHLLPQLLHSNFLFLQFFY